MENKYFQALIASLVAHLVLSIGVYKMEAPEWTKNRWEPVPIEVRYEKLDFRKKMYVKDPEVDDMLSRVKKDAQLLSKLSRRVKKQTVARRTGLSRNVKPSTPSLPGKSLPLPTISPPPSPKKLDLKPNSIGLDWNLANEPNNEQQATQDNSSRSPRYGTYRSIVTQSTISEHIPNVAKADITALNTDQGNLKYYTFFVRQSEQVRPRWVRRLRHLMDSASPRLINQISQKTRTTTLEVILDKDGYWVGSILVKSSGVEYLDMIAKDSFEAAAPFINPPKDMVEEDGHIYIPFSFRVEADPNYFARQ